MLRSTLLCPTPLARGAAISTTSKLCRVIPAALQGISLHSMPLATPQRHSPLFVAAGIASEAMPGDGGGWLLQALGSAPAAKTPKRHQLDSRGHIFVIEDALTQAECDAIVLAAEKKGFEAAKVDTRVLRMAQDSEHVSELRTDVRSNERIVFDSPEVAAALFNRLGPCFPPAFKNLKLDSFSGRIRLYKYGIGQFFKPHTDGGYVDEERGIQFVYTFLIYLNEVKSGGRTVFYKAEFGGSGVGGFDYRPAESPAPIQASTGKGLAFFHKTPHSGETVEAGLKYVLRMDAMYRYPSAADAAA